MNDLSLAGWQRRITNQEGNHCGITWIYRRASHLSTTTFCTRQTNTRYLYEKHKYIFAETLGEQVVTKMSDKDIALTYVR